MEAMTVEERNRLILRIFREIYSNIRSIGDFISFFEVDIDEENYRKLTNGTAYYYENWRGEDQDFEKFMNFLRSRSFRLLHYRSKRSDDGKLTFTNDLEKFTFQYFS